MTEYDSLTGMFKIEANKEGVWLTAMTEDFTQNDVQDFLKRFGVRRYEFRPLDQFIRGKGQKGNPCRIAHRDPAQEKDAKITVSLTKDNMTASVRIDPPFFTKPWPSEEDILAALKTKSVVFGIDRAAIQDMLGRRCIEEYIPVAHGKPPVEGKDAWIELIKDPDRPFEIRDDEKVDFWSRSTLVTVHPGQEIAVKHPLETGRDGLTVVGTIVKAPPVRNTEFSFGEGLARQENNPLTLVATADGQLKNQKGKLVVLPELDVPNDVDFGIGSIDFTGAVRIKGSVREGFHVIAQGNIDVHGMVEGADIDSQEAVIIHGGVRGMGKGTIKAGSDVSVSFADQATIRSGGSIIVKNAILHSRLYAQKAVLVLGSGKKSLIAGGRIEAGLEVSSHVLGSEMGTKTEVVVGLPPEQLEKRRVLQAEVKRCEENLSRIDPNLALLKKLEGEGQLDAQKRMMLMNLTKMKFQLQAALESMMNELNELEFQLGSVRDKGIVRVRGICYPGVLISIRGYSYQVHESCRYTSFIADDEARAITLRPFDYMQGHLGG